MKPARPKSGFDCVACDHYHVAGTERCACGCEETDPGARQAVPPEPQLTRVQCGVCAWMSAAHESPAEAYLEVGAHFVNVHRYADTAPSEPVPPTLDPVCSECGDPAIAEINGRPFCESCGIEYVPVRPGPAAAPPTVAPAREAAEAFLASVAMNCCAQLRPSGDHDVRCDMLTKVIAERDRASRSPGAAAVRAVGCPACGAAAGEACHSWTDEFAAQVAYCGRRIDRALANPPGQAKP